MAVAGISLDINADELKRLRENIQKFFPKKEAAEVLGQAIGRALAPALVRLRENTPLGPTGNLRRAADMKVVEYANNGVAVGILGYRRATTPAADSSAAGGSVKAGPERGYHQWWLEYGTQQRVVSKLADNPYRRKAHQRRMKSGKVATIREHIVSGQNSYIASSFNRLGPFKIKGRTEGGDGKNVQTDPPYQRAFFKKSRDPIVIPAMQPGGLGEPPLQKTWREYEGKVSDSISRELRISLEAAWETLRFRVIGSVTGTDTL